MTNVKESANFIWSIADLLRGDYKQSDYGKVILPLTVLRRLDCVLNATKADVLKKHEQVKTMNIQNLDPILNKVAGYNFHNSSLFDFDKLIADPNNIASNLRNYINGFSEEAREIIEQFEFDNQITKLDESNLLFMILKRFQEVDLHPTQISSIEMGYMFEELIRKFAEISNETAGEHFTPREVIRLMVNLLFMNDREILTQKGIVKTIFDCCAGTGGMLSVAEEYLNELNPNARLEVFGQELNPESYAICKSDMLIKGQKPDNIARGNSLKSKDTEKLKGDQFINHKFDYLITNPPFGVKWGKVQKEVTEEHQLLGHGGRYGAGLPSVSDGSFLFLMNLMSKMKPKSEGGSRLAIVFNGSPLFSGSPSSKKNESTIRQWIIENDLLEAVIALPNQLFYNTGISTYIWIISNHKTTERKGKVQLINAVDYFKKMSKSLGSKRNELSDEHITDITKLYGDFKASEHCKIFDNTDFGYAKVTVERPLVEEGKLVTDKKGKPKADAKLRDTENIPLKEKVADYMKREVLPHVPDAWIDEKKTKIGYEINFTKYFYKYKPLRSLSDIKADILALESETDGLIKKVMQ
ncbi:type I restriction-modification system subunit M [Tenacibaculum maritimum]|uniref:type I restriction-modification system subunit M n=1 Tax=Tenacibaculum maritimum TaxID=107401 RepID=UPI0012E56550|nr:class I SAM-dependent DNA methyltransferase [Tenacibaculum maritimum]MCD9581249.1 type I restriction-modification system subunit M [Tenacibaculum maritimum]MCD9635226.1 type I restriction-modification system subunit M [Tenacibaculum maritimum]CAA0260888.1 Restriction endonuclease subunit M [Tenacibaculum maritimum]